jgi:hypothetical protein
MPSKKCLLRGSKVSHSLNESESEIQNSEEMAPEPKQKAIIQARESQEQQAIETKRAFQKKAKAISLVDAPVPTGFEPKIRKSHLMTEVLT